jgi:hypothetical protein
LQQDSVVGNPADPRSLHRYAYAFNNPVNCTDLSGHMPLGGGSLLAGNNSSASGGLSSGSSSLLGNSSPNRSVNGNNWWSGSSNPTPKQQSRGFLPSLICGTIDAADTVVDVASVILGHDILTGEKLSHGMELLTFGAVLQINIKLRFRRIG